MNKFLYCICSPSKNDYDMYADFEMIQDESRVFEPKRTFKVRKMGEE